MQCNALVYAMAGFMIHCRCAGLSLARFEEISKSNDPFYCPSCCAARNQLEIHLLKLTLTSLTFKVNDLKAALSQITSQTMVSPNSDVENHKSPKRPKEAQPGPIVNPEHPPKIVPSSSNVNNEPDEKFNLAIYGIKESANETTKNEWIASDFEAATSALQALQTLTNNLSNQSIHDCIRLGEHTTMSNKPRPLLI